MTARGPVIIVVDVLTEEKKFDVHVMDAETRLTDQYEQHTMQDLTEEQTNAYIEHLRNAFYRSAKIELKFQ